MNIIEQLHQNVTPKVLQLVQHYIGNDQNKTHLLTSIYGILGARLSDDATAERVETLLKTNPNALHNGAKVLDALLQDEHGNSQVALLTSELSKEHNLPQSTTDAILATAAPLVLNEVKYLAKDSSIASYLQGKWSEFSHILPSWTHALLPAGLLAGFAGLAGGASAKVGELAGGIGNFAGKAAAEAEGLADDVKDGAKAAGAAALGAAGAAAAGLGALAGKALSGAGKLADNVKEGASKAADKAEDLTSKAAHEAGEFAGDVKDGAKAAGAAALGAAGAAAAGLGALAGKALSGAGKLADNVKEGASKAADKAEDLTSKAAHEAGEFAGDVKDGAKAAGAAALGAAGAAAAGLGALAGKALSGAGKLADNVKEGVKDGADAVVTTAENLTEKTLDKVDTTKENVKEAFVADSSTTNKDQDKSDVKDDKSVAGAVIADTAGAAVAAGALASQAAKDTTKQAKDFGEKAVDTAKDTVEKVEKTVEKTATKMADSTKAAGTAAASLASNAAQNVSHAAKETKDAVGGALHETAKQGGGFLKSLLPIIGLVILGALLFLMLRSCQTTKQPVAAPVAKPVESTAPVAAAANLKPATLSIATDDKGNALYSCRSQAGSEGVFASIRTALAGVFGTAEKCDFETTKGFAEDLPVLDHLPKLAALLKGVPHASISIDGKTVRFNGTDEAVVSKLVNDAKGILPSDFVVEAEPKLNTTEAVANSIDTAKEAMQNLDAQDASASEVVQALNMQIINFATSSNAIPDANKEVLNLAAEKLASLPDAHLKITGHTDSQGNHAFNQKLSERRAAAVRDYLVSKGIASERIEIFGASSDEPVASNATEQGRFQNRRIEFTLIEKDGTITSVGNAENSKAVKDTKAEEVTTEEQKTQ